MPVRPLQRLLLTLFFIAACALAAPASAQFSSQPGAGGGGSGSSTVTTPHVRAELVAHAPDGVGPGKPLWLGLSIAHQPEWHTYWKNSGDSGLPTQLEWRQLPAGIEAGEIAWPVPRKIPIGTLANYGYEGTVLLPVPMAVSSAFAPGPFERNATFTLQASWLVCRKECIPEEGTFTLQVPLASTTAMNALAFEAARLAHPQPLPAPAAAAAGGTRSHARVERGMLVLTVAGLPETVRGKPLDFFPETPGVIETAADGMQDWQGDVWTARVPISPQRSESPMPLPVVLAHGGRGWRAELPVEGGWPRPASAATVSPALEAALRANAQEQSQQQPLPPAAATPASAGLLATALLGALLGGLVLNLMPCVFPVLAIKVVGFARHGQDRRAHRLGGLAYTAGVVLSFLALGGAMLALRAAGEAVGWGFQLQSPAVVAALAALFTLIGLNLAGVFEFGRMLPSSLAGLQARHPVADAFLTGVLAVAVASPCTAPFMGASLGLTATLPAAQALAVFAALGLGLALPYLAASWVPAVARALPRPGAWMDTLRRFLAFPMFATVVWLVWVLGQQSGIDGAAALLALLVALGMVVWSLTLAGRVRIAIATISIAIFAMFAAAWGPKVIEMAPVAEAAPPRGGAAAATAWQPWRPGLADELLAQGRPVFVDYTAAWCVTCQFNKKTTLASDAVLRDLAGKNVALLRADWTRRDPAITAALAQLGRSGVPVYVLQAPGKAPVVFSEILGERELRSAVAAL
ncbi:protein-disulfide reductase DsbD family protein [Acidovorax sp. NCPPB 4044]|uniref:protein-disulfide reductase DsbD family protein n=1 Tax=Acidovorax sp. NCPPB 4044 TaxID=2940490 RepID=UPI002303CC64|nr:thioredoxin family protein [Acidovorax sp. NCPPB 4044]MDA8523711.1 thioredoxin family protein [Acidovorax sp. NCPPB 4044]